MEQEIIKFRKAAKILNDVSEVAGLIDRNGWAEKNAGNISINLTDYIEKELDSKEIVDLKNPYPEIANNYFYITATGKRMRDITKNPLGNGLVICLNNGGTAYKVIHSGEGCKPTSELPTHLGIHQMFKQRGSKHKVVLHSHATELIALTQSPEIKSTEALNEVLWNMHPESIVCIPQGVGFVPYTLQGTEDIAQATINMLQKHDIVLWEKHGEFAIGECILDTFDNIYITCKSAKIWFMCKSAGFTPEGLTEPQMAELRALAEKLKS